MFKRRNTFLLGRDICQPVSHRQFLRTPIMLVFLLAALPIVTVRTYSLSEVLIDLLLFASEPWRKLPVELDGIYVEWVENDKTCFMNCTKGNGESLKHLERRGKVVKFHNETKSFINATLAIHNFKFSYDSCSVQTKDQFSSPLIRHVGANIVDVSIFVEDNLSGCRAVISTVSLKSVEELIYSPNQLTNHLNLAHLSAVKDKIKLAVSRSIITSLNKAFQRLNGKRFVVPRHCSSI